MAIVLVKPVKFHEFKEINQINEISEIRLKCKTHRYSYLLCAQTVKNYLDLFTNGEPGLHHNLTIICSYVHA